MTPTTIFAHSRAWLIAACAAAVAGGFLLPVVAAGDMVNQAPARVASASCGEIVARGERYLVRVRRSTVSCRLARRVIEHTLTTGPGSMGGPGQPPRGWQCGWNYYRFPHGDDVRAGAACSGHGSEVFGYWRPHLIHCQDVTTQSAMGTTVTAHDVWAYRLDCGAAANWIDTFFSSLANPHQEAYTGATYGCGEITGNDAGCVGTSAKTGEVYFELE
jgi:hypothetical protein